MVRRPKQEIYRILEHVINRCAESLVQRRPFATREQDGEENMIEVKYLSYSANIDNYGSCVCCAKSSEKDPKMVVVRLIGKWGQGVVINLCDDCRKELCRKIQMEEPVYDTV